MIDQLRKNIKMNLHHKKERDFLTFPKSAIDYRVQMYCYDIIAIGGLGLSR